MDADADPAGDEHEDGAVEAHLREGRHLGGNVEPPAGVAGPGNGTQAGAHDGQTDGSESADADPHIHRPEPVAHICPAGDAWSAHGGGHSHDAPLPGPHAKTALPMYEQQTLPAETADLGSTSPNRVPPPGRCRPRRRPASPPYGRQCHWWVSEPGCARRRSDGCRCQPAVDPADRPDHAPGHLMAKALADDPIPPRTFVGAAVRKAS